MTRSPLPTLPAGYRGTILSNPAHLSPWSGASGPFWRPPRAVLLPTSRDDVSLLLPWAVENGVTLIPRGAGTGMPGGNVGPQVVLDLSRLADIRDLDDPGSTLTAGAGAVAARLRDRARTAGRDLPALPSSAPWCTLGGMVACNAAGARSFRYGAARAWVESVEMVRTDGTVDTLRRGAPSPPGSPWSTLVRDLEARLPAPLPWPRVRKNSSGYALDAFLESRDPVDLVVGSEGTLGVVTAATLRLQEPPADRAVILLGVPELDILTRVTEKLRDTPSALACEYFGRRLVELGALDEDPSLAEMDTSQGLLLVELGGTEDEVTRELEALGRWAAREGGSVTARDPRGMEALWEYRHAANPTLGRVLREGRRSTQFIEDCVVPPEHLPAFLTGLEGVLRRHRTEAVIFGHAGDGNLHVNPLMELASPRWRDRVEGILEETVDLVAELGGTLAGEHGDGRLRTPFLHRIFHPAVIEAFRTVKENLDPEGILNPGVIVPGEGALPLTGLGDAPAFALGTQGPEAAR